VFTSAGPRPLLDGVPEAQHVTEPLPAPDNEPKSPLREQLDGLSESARLDVLRQQVLDVVAAALGHSSADAIPADRTFRDLGLDSVIAADARTRLSAALGSRLPVPLVFDHPTPQTLAAHLLAQFHGSRSGPAPAVSQPAKRADEPIAIIAMSCRYPGE